MAHFYAEVRGGTGKVISRLGTKHSGILTRTASYNGGVQVELCHRNGMDYAYVTLIPWKGAGTMRVIYDGPVSGLTP